MSEYTKIYTSNNGRPLSALLFKEMFRDLRSSQNLAVRLAIRDIKATYRQSIFGVLWAFITPLMTAVVWIFLSIAGVVRSGDTPIPYMGYVFTGTLLWSIFMESLLSPLTQTQSAKGMMAKINFPKEALILSGFYKILFNSGIKVALMLVVILLLGVLPGWQLILFPVALFSLIFLGIALGMLITPIGMLYGDIGRGVPLIMQFLMYFSPALFVIPADGKWAQLMNINPLTPLLLNARNWLTGFDGVQLGYFWGVNLTTIIIFFLGWIFYRISIPIIIERSSS